jgi:hypothetical protein
MNGLLVWFYYARSIDRMHALKYAQPWPAFTNSRYPYYLVFDIILMNLQPWPDPAYRYVSGLGFTMTIFMFIRGIYLVCRAMHYHSLRFFFDLLLLLLLKICSAKICCIFSLDITHDGVV